MVEINVTGDETVAKLLAIRAKELGESTRQAAVALVVTMLKSLRGNTRVASENKGRRITAKDVTKKYCPTWKTENGGRRFMFTTGKGKRAREVKLPPDVRLYFDKECLGHRSFYCEDRRSPDVVYKWLILTDELYRAKSIVTDFHTKRVNRYKQLARFALGVSMAKLAKTTGLENVSKGVRRSSFENVTVQVTDSGLNDGEIKIFVKDSLDYAGKALRGGESFIEEAKNRAINQTIGHVIQKLKNANTLSDSLRLELESLKR